MILPISWTMGLNRSMCPTPVIRPSGTDPASSRASRAVPHDGFSTSTWTSCSSAAIAFAK